MLWNHIFTDRVREFTRARLVWGHLHLAIIPNLLQVEVQGFNQLSERKVRSELLAQ